MIVSMRLARDWREAWEMPLVEWRRMADVAWWLNNADALAAPGGTLADSRRRRECDWARGARRRNRLMAEQEKQFRGRRRA